MELKTPTPALRSKILRALEKAYGPRPARTWGKADPVLVETILSQNTSNPNSEAGYRVLYTRTTELVQKLQAARRDLALESALAKLDKFDLLILDDIAYAQKDQAETSVLFELIARRYETRSLAIAANQPFSAWERIFPDKAVTVAAIDRLVHHATILEMNVDSYRRRAAVSRKDHEAVAAAATAAAGLADDQDGAD